MAAAPTSDLDLFSDDALAEPYDRYRELRGIGPVVHLDRLDVLAVGRYAEAKEVLDDAARFCSGQGVGLNDFINLVGPGTTLMSDGEAHDRQRGVIGRPLTPKALAELRPQVQALADDLVDRLVAKGGIDAVAELAEVIPVTWVPDLLGWPAEGRDRLLEWAGANFDALGPPGPRADAGGPLLMEMVEYAASVAAGSPPAGSMAAGVLAAADRGDVAHGQCPALLIDYLAPSLDTTISAIGNAVWLFATHPEQWDLLRAEPGRAKNAFNEALRVESPISCFTRVATQATTVGDVDVPEGARVLVVFASANRDERRWPHPDRFDISREAAGQLGFGSGPHACAGMGLARLEGTAVLGALAARVARIDVGIPVRKLNNLIRAFGELPVTLHPA